MKEVKVLLMALCACALVGVFSACDYKAVSSNNDSSNVIENGDLTESLRFQKIAGKDEYRVMGVGTVSDLEIVIPATYRGLPVTEIGRHAFVNEVYTTDIVAGKDVNMFKEKMIYDT